MSSAVAMQAVGPKRVTPEVVGILVVSTNLELRRDITSRLQSSRWSIHEAVSGAEALERIGPGDVSVVLLDPVLPDLRVDEFKEIIQMQHPGVEIVPVNPHTGQAIFATPSPDTVSFDVLRDMGRSGPIRSEHISPSGALDSIPENGLPGFIGTAPSIQRSCLMARMVAPRDTTVLVTGESGTGKDLVARAVHQLSPRRMKPFVVINCAAIPEPLLEAELFGFVKGAFTGAVQSRIGRIHAAQGGTLFLDEIGDLPLGLQSKLLRFLEQGEIQRLGSSDTFRVDVRVVAATNSHLRRLVQEKLFREDLFYRLSVFPIELPPLRERMEDVLPLAHSFLSRFCPRSMALAPEAAALLQQHTWPGNVREVRNVMERASILVGENFEIGPEHIVI